MGTLLELRAEGPAAALQAGMEAALQAVGQVERLMSFHQPDSALSQLNRLASAGPVSVHPWLRWALRHALRVAAASGGLFDPCVAHHLVALGHLPDPGLPPACWGTWRDLEVLEDGRVRFARPLLIDLGGIAKGLAVDLAVHALLRAGCSLALVNAGGDLRRHGAGTETVHRRTARGFEPLAMLGNGAVATSAAQGQRPAGLAQPLGRIIDPHSGRAWLGASVSVAAPSCVMADALTKVAALAGPSSAQLLARFGARGCWHRSA